MVWSSIPEVEQNGVITFYEVCLEPLNFTDVLTTNRTRTVNRFQFFDEQQEFAVYSITVMGFTSIGPGPFSPPILVTTIEDGKLNIIIPHTSYFILHTSSFIVHTSYFILHTSYFILHTSYFILHTSYFILHTSYFILHTSYIPHTSSSTRTCSAPTEC